MTGQKAGDDGPRENLRLLEAKSQELLATSDHDPCPYVYERYAARLEDAAGQAPDVSHIRGSFAVEAVCLACFFAAGKRVLGWCALAFCGGAGGRTAALDHLDCGAGIVPGAGRAQGSGADYPGALDGVPIIGWLVGNNGGGWVVLGRAIGFHVAEAACCFVLAKSTENPEKRMLAMQREQRARLELQRFERIAALERRIFEHAFAAFDQVEQQLSGPVQVQALPAAGKTSEAVQAAKPKRTAAKAITAEFQTLDASQAGENEGRSNGHQSFRSR